MSPQTQQSVRAAFKKSCNCFKKQPDTDPTPPPTVGPRGRDYWYSQAIGSGLFYYDYFIRQTINKYLNSDVPDWCILATNNLFAYGYYIAGLIYTHNDMEETREMAWMYIKTHNGQYLNYNALYCGLGGWTDNMVTDFRAAGQEWRTIIRLSPAPDKKQHTVVLKLRVWFEAIPSPHTVSFECYYYGTTAPYDINVFFSSGPTVASFSSGNLSSSPSGNWFYLTIPSTYCPVSGYTYFIIKQTTLNSFNPCPTPSPGISEVAAYRMVPVTGYQNLVHYMA